MAKSDHEIRINQSAAWRAQPAFRALVGAGIQNLRQFSQSGEAVISNTHGVGPNALEKLHLAQAVQGPS